MNNLRVNPAAVLRTYLSRLDRYEPLSREEKREIYTALSKLEIRDAVERLLADQSKFTIKHLLAHM